MTQYNWIEYIRDLYGDEVIVESEPLWAFRRQIENCTRCALGQSRTHFVFGDGNPMADIMFVGEAPGEKEDLQGIPFVGRAGQLLDKLLNNIQLLRNDVFIANVLKCRPPGNRDPRPDEIILCEPYLQRQIELIKPNVIVALGRIAGKTLIKEELALKEMRGRKLSYQGVDLFVTYHPAAVLRNMNLLSVIEDDFRYLKEKYVKK